MGVRRGIIIAVCFAVALWEGKAGSSQQPYGWEEAARESYFYAWDNLQALVTSGLGIPLEKRQEILSTYAREAGLPAFAQESPLFKERLIAVPYASGDPSYVQSGSLQWDEQQMDRTVTTEAIAWTIIASVSSAKWLEQLYQLSQTAETRLWAMVLGRLAGEAARFAHANLRDPQTELYARAWKENVGISDPAARPGDQLAMLWALSELISLAQDFSFYRGTLSGYELSLWASSLFRAILPPSQSQPEWLALSVHDRGLLMEALASYAMTLSDPSALGEVVDLIGQSAERLKEKLSQGDLGEDPLATWAEAVRALLVAGRLLSDDSWREAALEAWNSLQALWDDSLGLFRASPAQAPFDYTPKGIGAIAGAFGAVIYGAGRQEAQAQYARFFENALKASHLMIAEGEEAGGDADMDGVSSPRKAGGPLGKAPVFAGSVQYDPSTRGWYATNERFHTAGAMYLAARLLWIGQRDGQAFLGPPRWGLPENPAATLIRLKREMEVLRAASEKFEGLRQLLMTLEARVEELKKQAAAPPLAAEDLARLQKELGDLRGQMASELAAVKQQLAALETPRAPQPTARAGRFTVPDVITLVLIALIVLVGFVAYQRLQKRS